MATSGAIAGYYTLASAGIPVSELPADFLRRLPRYPTLPAVRIGRLAVDGAFRRRGLGELLLIVTSLVLNLRFQTKKALAVFFVHRLTP